MNLYIKNAYGRSAQDHDIKPLFGLDRKAKWPAKGIEMRVIQGVNVWVEPIQPGKFRLRAMCQCPECGFVTAIGRLAQHSKVHQ